MKGLFVLSRPPYYHKRLLGIAFLLFASSIVTAQDYDFYVENKSVQQYMEEVTYSSIDDASRISEYVGNDRADLPNTLVLRIPVGFGKRRFFHYGLKPELTSGTLINLANSQSNVVLRNLVPGLSYYYHFLSDGVVVKSGFINTIGQVRMIHAPSISNIRDMGGWLTTDGRRIQYEKIYRGGEMNGGHIASAADIQELKKLGIAAELDLRAWYNEDNNISAMEFLSSEELGGGAVPSYLYTNDSGQLPEHFTKYMYLWRWREEFEFIVENLRAGRAVYQHCVSGADRTGYLSMLLEGLLGVPYDGLVKDYELTSFSKSMRKKETIDGAIAYIMTLEGNTLQEKFKTFFTRYVGVRTSDINYFIYVMLGGNGVEENISRRCNSHTSQIDSYDIFGRKIHSAKRKGITVEMSSDGTMHKVLR